MNSGGQGNRPKKTRSAPMPSSNNNSRYRGKEPRPSQHRPLEASGVYADPKYAHALSSVIGCPVQVLTTAHQRFEGVLVSVSSENALALGMVNLVNEADPKRIDPKDVKEKIIFKSDQVVMMTVRNVDLDYAAKSGFQTDGAIQAKTNGGPAAPKELQPWVADDAPPDQLVTLDSANGWDARDMFKLNERKYGVRSTYDQSLQGYTTQLEQSSRDQEAHASRIADEIERSGTSKQRADMENGDEEAAFAAVSRPGGERGDRYVPPARRQPSRDPPSGPRQGGPRGPPPSGRPPRGGGGPQGGGMGSRGPPPHRGGGGRPPHARASPPAHLQPPPHHGRVNGDGGERGSPPAQGPATSPPARGASKSPAMEQERPRGRSPEERPAPAEPPRRGGDARGSGDVRSDSRPADVRNGDARHASEGRGGGGTEPRPSGDVRVSGESRPSGDVRVSGESRGSGDVRVSGGGGRGSGDVRASDDVRASGGSRSGGEGRQQRPQNGGKSSSIDSLKSFKQSFVLSEEPARREEPAAAAAAQRTPPPAAQTASQSQSQGQKPEPPAAQTPETKPSEGEAKPAAGSKSKLNPNAKAFTPSQPSSLPPVGYSPAPTPPRVVTPMAAVQPGPFPSIVPAGYPSPVQLGGYLPMAAPQYGLAPQPQPQPQPQPPPRLQKQRAGGGEYPGPMAGVPHRAEAATPMQVAAVTGQPLMAPSPMGGHPPGPHLPMALPQPGLVQATGPASFPGGPVVLRMMPHGPIYGAPGPQQAYDPTTQQGGPPPGPAPHQLAYGMVPQPGPGPAQPPTPGPQPTAAGPGGLMYPVAAGAAGGPAGHGGPGGPTSMYLVSAGQQVSQQMAQFALLQQQQQQQQGQPQQGQQPAGGQLSVGPMTSGVTSVAMSLGPTAPQYYIPSQQQHPGQTYGPAGGVPMPLVPNHQ